MIESHIFNRIKDSLSICKSVHVEQDDENNGVLLFIRRYNGQNTATSNQVKFLNSIENFDNSISNYKLYKIHSRVMSTIIDTILSNSSVRFRMVI